MARRRLSAAARPSLRFVSSGAVVLDCCLGGGWPLGRIVNVVGDRSSGKTLLAIEACANFARQYREGMLFYLESEAAFDKEFAETLGLPVDRVEFIEDCVTVEGACEAIDACASKAKKAGVPALFVLDSLDALSDAAELSRGMTDASYGADKARRLSEMFRRVTKKVQQADMLLFIISQVRDKIGVVFGKRVTRSGGRALDFYATQIVWLKEKGKLHRTVRGIKRPIGIEVQAQVEKNKVGPPFRSCTFPILFGYGIDDLAASLQYLEEAGALDLVDDGLKKSNLQKFITKANRLPDKEYRALVRRTGKAVRRVWREVEDKFAPARRKY